MVRVASDIGGTFTDLVFFDEITGNLGTAKSLTTPSDLTRGVINTIELSGVSTTDVNFFVHGGTTVINAITERKGAKTALITTFGFRDVLEIQRGNRPDLYNLRFEKEEPIVPRFLRFEVTERVSSIGEELVGLNTEDLDSIISVCREEGVEAIAIQFLHSYAAPEHEEKTATYLRKKLPNVSITASYEITREWREYERANTAVLNAYVQPIIQKYFSSLENELQKSNVRPPYAAMQSNGGTTSFDWAKEHPITLMESGPAAGCNGAAIVGELCGEPQVIYLDIGGTTAKCTTIEDGKPKVTTDYRLEYTRTQFGYPVRVPIVDIVEIGAGGGSIAWFDKAGLLKVGPVSSGADPGPACYGLGGNEPTVTDAKLITGVINPKNFASGQFDLDIGKARTSMQKIANGLNNSIEDAAVAVIRTAEANMINALKLVSIQRGHDPREFSLVVGGGGGAMHGAPLGRELGVKGIIVPLYPGLFSAWGMLATEPRRDFMRTVLKRAEDVSDKTIKLILDELKSQATDHYGADTDIGNTSISFEFGIDLRYLGQEHSVTVPVDINSSSVDSILDSFHKTHEKTYTFKLIDTPVEFVTYRLAATASVPRPEVKKLSNGSRSIEDAHAGKRMVNFLEDGRHEAAIYLRDRLPSGCELDGPIIIEEATSTTIVHPGQSMIVDDFGFLRISEGKSI
tara:strand:- start:1712 stop:3766 length:2055 start_codon:yes stop_codon:yes gene_type:complete